MGKYILDISAYRTQLKEDRFGSHEDAIGITAEEIFEAISKYLQVKGFHTHILSVEDEERDVKTDGSLDD